MIEIYFLTKSAAKLQKNIDIFGILTNYL
jgi:hypothetical protein